MYQVFNLTRMIWDPRDNSIRSSPFCTELWGKLLLRSCKENKITNLEVGNWRFSIFLLFSVRSLEAVEVTFLCIYKSVSRKESVKARISSAVFRVPINFSWSFLQITSSGFWAGSPVNTVIGASPQRLGREAWFKALCTQGSIPGHDSWAIRIHRIGFSRLARFPYSLFGSSHLLDKYKLSRSDALSALRDSIQK